MERRLVKSKDRNMIKKKKQTNPHLCERPKHNWAVTGPIGCDGGDGLSEYDPLPSPCTPTFLRTAGVHGRRGIEVLQLVPSHWVSDNPNISAYNRHSAAFTFLRNWTWKWHILPKCRKEGIHAAYFSVWFRKLILTFLKRSDYFRNFLDQWYL